MTDPSHDRDPGDDAALKQAPESDAGLPRWVKVSGIAAIIVVLLLAVMLLVGGGDHGPSRHAQSGDGIGPASSSSQTGHGVRL